jgi:tRNA modification GTPase
LNDGNHKSVLEDVIIARSTSPGPGAIAVIRLDGRGVTEIMNRVFMPFSGDSPAKRQRHMVYGQWIDPVSRTVLDDGLAVFFGGPRSYTGNDMAEFQCHGGPIPVRMIMETLLGLGCRLAEPGEFTRKAFLNGRMDLAQAEAVADLISAQTESAAACIRKHINGEFSRKISSLRENLVLLAAEIEARMDFPEENLGDEDFQRLQEIFDSASSGLRDMLKGRRRGQLLRLGARVVLTGPANAGKSSLLNALARRERAIVTPHPGTTRDTVECTIDMNGYPLTLVDTAGLRASDDPVELLGMDRTREAVESADLVICLNHVTDDGLAMVRHDTEYPGTDCHVIEVLNKSDLINTDTRDEAPRGAIPISTLDGTGLDILEDAVLEKLTGGEGADAGDNMAIGLRQGELMNRCLESLDLARQAFAVGTSGEFVMVDLREAIDSLSSILGVETGDIILDRIFSRFCLGK